MNTNAHNRTPALARILSLLTLLVLFTGGADRSTAQAARPTTHSCDWRAVQDLPEISILSHVWGAGPADVYAVGINGMILHSTGNGWQRVGHGLTAATLRSTWGSGPADIYVAGDSGTILHYDGQT